MSRSYDKAILAIHRSLVLQYPFVNFFVAFYLNFSPYFVHTLLISKLSLFSCLSIKFCCSLTALKLYVIFIYFLISPSKLLLLKTFVALNGILCADVLLRNYLLTHSLHMYRL